MQNLSPQGRPGRKELCQRNLQQSADEAVSCLPGEEEFPRQCDMNFFNHHRQCADDNLRIPFS
jgi:hypothetical protein